MYVCETYMSYAERYLQNFMTNVYVVLAHEDELLKWAAFM